MTLENLLKGVSGCGCGREHSCEIQAVSIRPGALEDLPRFCEPYSHILLVADANTYEAAGRRAEELLGERLEDVLVYAPEGLLIPDETAIAELERHITAKTELVLGVGAGVINDLCKYCSFRRGLPYYIAATAPSMDGYASTGAAMITGGMKTTFPAHMPAAIIGDVDVLKNAPMRLIQSGFGDIVGKYSALNDWKLARLVNGEYFCQFVCDLTYDMVLRTQRLAAGILERREEAVATLMEALVTVGVAMSFAGSSRPASGSEHHLSHFFEITGILHGEDYLLHGIDVAYSTVRTQQLREELLQLKAVPDDLPALDRSVWEREIRRIYGRAADGVLALQKKCGHYERDYANLYRKQWDTIREILREAPSSEKLKEILRTAGLDYGEFETQYSPEKLRDAVRFAKDLKDRYTLLWLYDLLLAGTGLLR